MNRNLAFVAIIYDRIGTRIKDVFENDAGNNLAQFFNLNPGAESLLTQLEHVDTEEQINAPPNVGSLSVMSLTTQFQSFWKSLKTMTLL